MSKMADIALQLDEQSAEYGLQSYQEALEQGFTYEVAEDGTATLTPPSNGLEMAHEAWLKEKGEILSIIESVKEDIVELNGGDNEHVAIEELNRVIDFVEGCHD